MSHRLILLSIFGIVFFLVFLHAIKNRPDYLVLLGIRGLLSYVLIQLINYMCSAAHLPALILSNPLTLSAGGLLGFPGILLLYAIKLYFYSF